MAASPALASAAGASDAVRKAYKSSVCIIPPPALWQHLQAIRSHHDKVYRRWPPHINILYPFYSDLGGVFLESAVQLSEALSTVKPFEASLSTASTFLRKRQCTVYAEPSPSKSFHNIHAACLSCFPDCDDTASAGAGGYTPHLSLAQFGRKKAPIAVDEINAAWQGAAAAVSTGSEAACAGGASAEEVPPAQARRYHKPIGPVLACDAGSPVSWRVTHVYIISRASFTDPFHVRYRVPLGGGTPEAVAEGSSEDWISDGALLLSPGVWSSEEPADLAVGPEALIEAQAC